MLSLSSPISKKWQLCRQCQAFLVNVVSPLLVSSTRRPSTPLPSAAANALRSWFWSCGARCSRRCGRVLTGGKKLAGTSFDSCSLSFKPFESCALVSCAAGTDSSTCWATAAERNCVFAHGRDLGEAAACLFMLLTKLFP